MLSRWKQTLGPGAEFLGQNSLSLICAWFQDWDTEIGLQGRGEQRRGVCGSTASLSLPLPTP